MKESVDVLRRRFVQKDIIRPSRNDVSVSIIVASSMMDRYTFG